MLMRTVTMPIIAGLALSAGGCAPSHGRWQSPPNGLLTSAPELQGVESGALADAIDVAITQHMPIHELLMVRHGAIVLNTPFSPFPDGSRHDIASITKSVMSLLVGIAVQSGALRDANVTLGEVFPGTDAPHAAIRIADLLGMQSGMECGFARGEAELRAMKQSRNWVDFALHMPMRGAPGAELGYCSPNYHLLSAILTRVTGKNAAQFAGDVLFSPLGITDVYWPSDPQGVTHGWGDLQLRAADLAKIGLLMLRGGVWNGTRIVSREWIRWSTTPHVQYRANDYYAFGWWTHPDAPPGFFEAMGRGGQRLSILPEKDVVVVMLGGGYEPGLVGAHLVRAVESEAPLPPVAESRARLARSIYAAGTRVIDEAHDLRPACADSISERAYRVDANSLGLQTFTLHVRHARDGTIHLELPDRSLDLPVRADGRFAAAKQAVDGIEPMSRGFWKAPCTFTFVLDLLGKIDHYTLDIAFSGGAADVSLDERTGLMREIVHATRARQP
jgi:CubicO group peptidase (beta-lactamase class C family)